MIRGVPYDAEVEWLESTGTQWIDTRLRATLTSKIFIDFVGKYGGNYAICGASNGSAYKNGEIAIFWRNDIFDLVYPTGRNSSSVEVIGSYVQGNRYIIIYKSQQAIINGQTFQTSTWSNEYIADRTFFIGAVNRGTANNYPGSGLYYGFKMWDGDVLDGDFIPVRFTNEQGVSEGAMYDRVTRKLFRNKGTGAFKWGPDVARPIMGLHFMKPRYTARDYVQDGLIYHLDAAENIGYGQFSDITLIWVNLKGGNNATIPSATPLTWSKTGCDFKGRTYNKWIFIPTAAFPSTVRTVEWCGCSYNAQIYARHIADDKVSGTNTNYFGISNNYDANGRPNKLGIFLGTGSGTSQINFNVKAPAQGVFATTGIGLSSLSDIRGIVNGQYYSDRVYDNVSKMPTFNVGMCMPSKSDLRTCDIICCNLRVYDRMLTAAEIAHNYAIDKARFNLPEVTA